MMEFSFLGEPLKNNFPQFLVLAARLGFALIRRREFLTAARATKPSRGEMTSQHLLKLIPRFRLPAVWDKSGVAEECASWGGRQEKRFFRLHHSDLTATHTHTHHETHRDV